MPVNSPLLDEGGYVAAILHHVEDVTAACALLGKSTSEIGTTEHLHRLARGTGRLITAAATLDRHASRLGDALCALAATRTPTTSSSGLARRAEIWRAIAASAGESEWAGWSHTICATAVHYLDTVDAATVTLVRDGGRKTHVIAATSRWACELSALEGVLFGPTTMALRSGTPVITGRLADDTAVWPEYAEAATGHGLAAVAAYPLALSDRPFGVLTLYRLDPDIDATASEHVEATLFADLSVAAVLADLDHIADTFEPNDDAVSLHLIAAATRALTLRQDISYDTALSRLRVHALLHGQTTLDTARQVLCRQLTRIE